MMVGGSVGLETSNVKLRGNGVTRDQYKSTYFYLEPQVGFFVIDNLAIGGGLGVGVGGTKYSDQQGGGKSTGTQITVEPFARYYLPQNIFFQGKFLVGTMTSKWKDDGETDKTSYSMTGFSVSAGYAIMLNDNVAIEPQLGYGLTSEKNKDTDVKELDGGLFLRAGFQIYLR